MTVMKETRLHENERLDAVNDRLCLIQKTDGLTFGTDALLLAAFIAKSGEKALELGGGSGIISMLLSTRNRFTHITCVEVQETFAQLIERNVRLNDLTLKISPLLADIRETEKLGALGTYDAVFSNPPYMTVSSGEGCRNEGKNIARHELFGGIFDFAACASKMLKFGGSFYTVYRTDRMIDLIEALRSYKLEPKRMTFVHARAELPPCMVLTEARLGGKSGLKITRPLILSSDERNTADYDYLLQNGILPKDFL